MHKYYLTLKDQTVIDSDILKEWRSVSSEFRAVYQEGHKTVFLCKLPVVKIKIQYNDLETEMEVPEDCKVYKANRGQLVLAGGKQENKLVGVCIGLVKDGEVVEERVLNIAEEIIQGWRK